jgi:CO/xanthine dehydrogenase Mo-binding subunit
MLTALAQIAAETRPAMTSIRMVSGDTTLTPDEGYTSGSQSIEHGGTAIRFACAEARAILIEKASVMLSAPKDRLKIADGVITATNGRKLTYGEIAAAGLFHRAATASALQASCRA